MLNGCGSLKTINLSNFDTSKVTNMAYMFYGCDSLIILDLSYFNLINCYLYDQMFSNYHEIRYVNLYGIKNDKIISETFNKINNLFVCQKDKIITNAKAYICCNYNLETDDCDTDFGVDSSEVILYSTYQEATVDSSDKSKDKNESKESSSRISIGLKVGIIIGVLIIIGIIIAIIYLRRKLKPANPQSSIAVSVFRSSEDKINEDKPKMITITFQTTSQYIECITIDQNITMRELIKLYFKKINRTDLIGDKSIVFLKNGNAIEHDSDIPVKKFIVGFNVGLTIVVYDNDQIKF